MYSPMKEWDRTAPLAARLISYRKEYVSFGGSRPPLLSFERIIPAAAQIKKTGWSKGVGFPLLLPFVSPLPSSEDSSIRAKQIPLVLRLVCHVVCDLLCTRQSSTDFYACLFPACSVTAHSVSLFPPSSLVSVSLSVWNISWKWHTIEEGMSKKKYKGCSSYQADIWMSLRSLFPCRFFSYRRSGSSPSVRLSTSTVREKDDWMSRRLAFSDGVTPPRVESIKGRVTKLIFWQRCRQDCQASMTTNP